MRARAVLLSLLFVGWLLAGSAAFAAPAAANTIAVDTALSETDAAGEVDGRTTVTIPSGTASLQITLPEETDVYETDGFRQSPDDPNTYEWTQTTNQPSLRYTYEGNVTIDRGNGPEYIYAVTDEWAIVRTPSITVQWSGVQADVTRDYRVDGEGVSGDNIAYLGPYTEHDRETTDQRFRLVASDHGDMAESPEDVLDALAVASRRIQGGERDDEVLVFVVPSSNVEWAATGIQRGDSDLWVRDVERLDTPANTWVHEYVHTRQDYERTEKTRWTIEGMADYYAALISYEQGYIDYEALRQRMESGTADRYDEVQLTDPSTWEGTRGNYEKGALVFGHLDRRLRTDADSSIDAVLREVNKPDEKLTHEAFLDAIENAGNADIREDAVRYTETTATPDLWSKEEHVEAFGGPDIRYEIVGFAVDGPYRQTALDEPSIVTDETLQPTVRVRNVGDQEGEFTAEFVVGDDIVDAESGTLGPGEETTVEFAHQFNATGEYPINVGAATNTVTVDAPADPVVTGLTADPTDAALGESVTIRATVDSSANRPADGEIAFTADGEPIGSKAVAVVEGSTTVTLTTSFDSPSEHTVGAGDRSTTVTVRDETVTPGAGTESPGGTDGTATPTASGGTTPTEGAGAGFGVGVAALALLAGSLFARRE